MKDKLSLAIKEIEIHKAGLSSIKEKLEARYKNFLEITKKEGIYEMEYSELKKAVQMVNESELVLNQLILKLETLKDLGDVIYHLSATLKVMRNLDKSISDLLPNFEGILDELNSTLKETIIKLKITPISLNLDLEKEEGKEFIEKAIEFIEKKNKEEILKSKEKFIETKRLALLATGESISEEEPILSLNSSDFDGLVLNYIREHKDNLNLIEVSTLLNAPLDEIKFSILRLLNEGKISFKKGE